MRVSVLAAAERSAASSLDAAMVDGSALATALHKAGHDVDLHVLPSPGSSLGERALAVLEAGATMLKLALDKPAPDAVVVVSPPHLAALAADGIAGARGIPGVVVLTSLTTEARVRSGELPAEGPLTNLLLGIEAALVKRARVLVVPTEALRRRVLLKGAHAERVRLVRLLFAPIIPRPDAAAVSRVRQRLAEGAPFLVVLPASLGAATDMGALAGALTRLRDDNGFAFAAVGGGSRARTLQEMVSARGIRNAKVVHLARADRRAAVHAADALLGLAVPAQDGLSVPRALTRSLWAEKPLVAVGPEGCELVREVRRLGLGPTVPPGDGDGLATVLRSLAADPVLRADLCRKAAQATSTMSDPVETILAQLDGAFPATPAATPAINPA